MSFLKDFNEFHVSLKGATIGLAVVLPFWYFDLYLFHKQFFFNNNIYIPIIATFCLSVAWYGINAIAGLTCAAFILIEKNEKPNNSFSILVASLVSVGWIALLTYTGHYFSWKITKFINISFTVSIARFLLWRSMFTMRQKEKIKEATLKRAKWLEKMTEVTKENLNKMKQPPNNNQT